MAQNREEITGDEEKYPRYRWVVIGLLVFSQVVSFLVVGGIGMLLPAMRAELGFGMTESGLLASLGHLPGTVLLIPASLFLVRFSPKRVYFCALVLAAVAGFVLGRAPVFAFLAVAYCFMGATMMARFIPNTLLMLQWIPKRELGRVMGLTNAMRAMGQSMALMIIPFLLIVLESWRNLFSIYSLAVLLMSIIWMVFARERITPAYQEGMDSQAGRAPLRGVLKRKEFFVLGLGSFGILNKAYFGGGKRGAVYLAGEIEKGSAIIISIGGEQWTPLELPQRPLNPGVTRILLGYHLLMDSSANEAATDITHKRSYNQRP